MFGMRIDVSGFTYDEMTRLCDQLTQKAFHVVKRGERIFVEVVNSPAAVLPELEAICLSC